MTSRQTGHRLRSGLWAVSDLTTDYEIANLTVPSDGTADEELWCVSADGSTPPQPARISQTADGNLSADGFMNFSWRMSYITLDMLPIFLTAAGLTNSWSAPVTVMDYDEMGQEIFLTALILRPQLPSADGGWAINGWQSVIWKFVRGQIIT